MELEASVEDGEAGLLGDWQAVQRACREAEVAGGASASVPGAMSASLLVGEW